MAEEGRTARPDLAFSFGVFVLAFVARLVVAFAIHPPPAWDGAIYHRLASHLADGAGYVDTGARGLVPASHYPIGYPAFLAAFYRLGVDRVSAAYVANAVVGALVAAVAHRVARRMWSPARARVAGVALALSPGLVAYAGLLMTETLASLAVVVAWWSFVREPRPMRGAAFAGVALGLGALVRPEVLLFSGGLAWANGTRARPVLAPPALALAVALSIVAPWTARNCATLDGCALVSTNAGWNAAIGAFPRATGRYEPLRPSDGCDADDRPVAEDRCWAGVAVDAFVSAPFTWIARAPSKLAFTFDHESFQAGYFAEGSPRSWPADRRTFWRRVFTATHVVMVLLAAAAVAGPRRPTAAWCTVLAAGALGLLSGWHLWPVVVAIPLVAFARRTPRLIGFAAFAIAAECAVRVAFFGDDRYHVVIAPLFVVLACGLHVGERDRAAPQLC